nr:MAG TPA: hypothetical protein [Caudoviricetes sp.]
MLRRLKVQFRCSRVPLVGILLCRTRTSLV